MRVLIFVVKLSAALRQHADTSRSIFRFKSGSQNLISGWAYRIPHKEDGDRWYRFRQAYEGTPTIKRHDVDIASIRCPFSTVRYESCLSYGIGLSRPCL
jgi:hypothetical protein